MINRKHICLFAIFFFFFALLKIANDVSACERCLQASGFIEIHQHADETTVYHLISSHGELRDEAEKDLYFFESRDVVQRYRVISLDDRTKGSGWVQEDDHLIINLFDDVEYEVHVQRVKVNVNGTFSITGVLPGGEGYMVLATTGSRSLGSIFIPSKQKYYRIISDPVTYTHYLIELDAKDRDIIECGGPMIPDVHERDIEHQHHNKDDQKEQGLGPDDYAVIGVMVVYTRQAETWAINNASGIENVIAAAMANAQLVLHNSDVLMRVILVHSALVNYNESGKSNIDLVRLTASSEFNPWGESLDGYTVTGHMYDVHHWRDKYRASLVSIFTLANDVGGLAWLLTDRFGTPNLGFSMTRVQQAMGYTHIHEMGHNMGLHHHADQSLQPGPTNWSNWPENSWSAGWRWVGDNNNRYCSVMSYSSGEYFSDGQDAVTTPFFSNPQVMHLGARTGHIDKGNNARTLREIKHVIANYRPMGNPAVKTVEPKEITSTTAISGGDIDDLDGLDVQTRGIVWSRSDNPTVNNNEGMTAEGEGPGQFVSKMTDLVPDSKYQVRAYAATNEGVVHGTFRLFTTQVAYKPSVVTLKASSVTHSAAMIGGDIPDDGNAPITARGIVWSTKEDPDIDDNMGKTNEGTGVGPFMSKLTGLSLQTTYYYRSYATNVMGTSYGEQFRFTTGPKVYPNPASNQLWVEFNNDSLQPVSLVLASYMGEVVKRKVINEQGYQTVYFNTEALRGGLYLVYFEPDKKLPVFKVLITRQ